VNFEFEIIWKELMMALFWLRVQCLRVQTKKTTTYLSYGG